MGGVPSNPASSPVTAMSRRTPGGAAHPLCRPGPRFLALRCRPRADGCVRTSPCRPRRLRYLATHRVRVWCWTAAVSGPRTCRGTSRRPAHDVRHPGPAHSLGLCTGPHRAPGFIDHRQYKEMALASYGEPTVLDDIRSGCACRGPVTAPTRSTRARCTHGGGISPLGADAPERGHGESATTSRTHGGTPWCSPAGGVNCVANSHLPNTAPSATSGCSGGR